jgi:putative endonuclease
MDTSPERIASPDRGTAWTRMLRHPRLRLALLRCDLRFDKRVSLSLLGVPLTTAEVGAWGELLACRYLRERGRKVLYRNYRGPNRGEVDIVARHRDVLTFVEVKTRSGYQTSRPADAVTQDKQRLIQRGALAWLRLLGNPPIKFRFDIMEIVLVVGELPRFNLIENAFQMPAASTAGRSGTAG